MTITLSEINTNRASNDVIAELNTRLVFDAEGNLDPHATLRAMPAGFEIVGTGLVGGDGEPYIETENYSLSGNQLLLCKVDDKYINWWLFVDGSGEVGFDDQVELHLQA